MTVVAADAVLDRLRELHNGALRAGRAHVAGDQARTLHALNAAQRALDRAVEVLDPEPAWDPKPKRCSQQTELPGTSFEDIFGDPEPQP